MITQYIVDAFTDQVFSGNPAAVCIMDQWLPEDLMQAITRENNLSETAFAVPIGPQRYHLRWFTPGGEIDLCGHATLATAFVLSHYYQEEGQSLIFETLGGSLHVRPVDNRFEMTFPAYPLRQVPVTEDMIEALGCQPLAAFLGRDLVCILDREEQVRDLTPNLDKVAQLEGLLVHVTAPGVEYDCVSRSFAPRLSVAEDPVCGSGHCHIIPYWAKVTGKDQLVAYQASQRGGQLYCRLQGQDVVLAGQAVLYAQANLML